MKKKIIEKIEIPEGITCIIESNKLKCSKGSLFLEKPIILENTSIIIESNNLIIENLKGNKKEYSKIKSLRSHIKNMFQGLDKPFVYELEACNVHFPMSLKVESGSLAITNFLGERQPRIAKIIPGVEVEIKGQNISVSSPDIESAGKTAANFEKATKVKGRDRRVFQDGIHITKKPAKVLEEEQ